MERAMIWNDEHEEFTITDDGAADWALQQVKAAREEQARLEAHFNRQIEKSREVLAQIEERFGAWLRAYFQTLPVRKTKTQEAYDLPSGKLILKRQAPEFKPNKDVLAQWLIDNRMTDMVKTVYEPKWGELKPLTRVNGEDVVFEKTGEIIPGVKAIARADKFVMEV